jgi:hypothetical protein
MCHSLTASCPLLSIISILCTLAYTETSFLHESLHVGYCMVLVSYMILKTFLNSPALEKTCNQAAEKFEYVLDNLKHLLIMCMNLGVAGTFVVNR